MPEDRAGRDMVPLYRTRAALRTWAARLLRIALLAYVGSCALLYVQQRALIYPAQHTSVPVAATDFALDRDDAILRGWRINPGRDHAILYFGGNAERIEHARAPLAATFPDATLYLLAYRGYGASDGSPSEAALYADALALFDAARSARPHARIDVIGRSLGSGVASYLARHRPVARLVLVTPFDSLAGLAQSLYPLLPVRWLLEDRYDSARHLAGYARPILVVRAGRDAVVTPASTNRLLATLPASVTVIDLAERGHNDIDADPRYIAALAAFLGQGPADDADATR